MKSAFPNCCGITIINGYNSIYNTLTPLTDIQKKHILDDLKAQIQSSVSVGLLLIAINSNQITTGLGEVILDAGFVDLTGPCFHPGHGRKITVYGYEIHPSKREKTEPTFPPNMKLPEVIPPPEKKSNAGIFQPLLDTGETTPLKKKAPPGFRVGKVTGKLYKIRNIVRKQPGPV